CFDKSDTTRLSSSSPVAATTTSASSTWAFSSTHSSHASPNTTVTPGAVATAFSVTDRLWSMSQILWPRSARSMARWRPTAPAPAITTRMASLRRQRRQQVVEGVERVSVHDHVGHVSLLERARRVGDESLPSPVHSHHEHLALRREAGDGLAQQMGRNLDPHPEQVPSAQALVHLLARVEQHQDDLLGGPLHAGHRRDVEPLVDLRPPGIVDPSDDGGHVVVLAGHAGGQDVGVVAGRDGDEGVGLLDPRLLEGLAVEAHADEPPGLEPGGEPVEGLLALVDDGDVVAGLAQFDRELGPHTPASHD